MTKPSSVSVVLPVKDGARYLSEVLEALAQQEFSVPVEILVVDSGSQDGSVEIARAAGARVVEIRPDEFGHGKTRNFAAEQTSGDALVFLTQDAAPASTGWLAALIAPLDSERKVGLSFGPHLPRPDTSPMVARELSEFFESFSPNAEIRIDESLDVSDPGSGFFSNVNSAILRSCWSEVGFREVEYAEDQAFARDAFGAGWKKAYVPAAGVLHAHDYPFTQFMRRYFDEYRGLRETVGHVEPRSPIHVARAAVRETRADLRYMRKTELSRVNRFSWGVRSARHNTGKRTLAVLGSRAHRLPKRLRSLLSLEGRGGKRSPERPQTKHIKPHLDSAAFNYVLSLRDPEPPLAPPHAIAKDSPLEIAWIVPPFARGSGGHMTIFTLIRELERIGHSNSIWVHDPDGDMARRKVDPAREINEHFMPLKATIHGGLAGWTGADIAMATGWQTAYAVRALPQSTLKTYLVQDYEPDFYAASSSRLWAEATYEMGFPCICASTWLRDLMHDRYGVPSSAFELGVDFDTYGDRGARREPATIVWYARESTPRRATELGLLALSLVVEQRPDCRVVVFGNTKPLVSSFHYEFAGVIDAQSLAALYNESTVGLVISLTNYSRTPKEMMACGLPVVDIDHPSVISAFADGDAISLASADPQSIADRLLALLDDPQARARQAGLAKDFISTMTWEAAAKQIEQCLRAWRADRSRVAEQAGVDSPAGA